MAGKARHVAREHSDVDESVALLFTLAVVLLRRLPLIAILRRPLDLHWIAVLFYGWFGPVGVSALFYLTHAHEEGASQPEIWGAGNLVVAVSVLAHGVTGAPFRRRYAQHADPDVVSADH